MSVPDGSWVNCTTSHRHIDRRPIRTLRVVNSATMGDDVETQLDLSRHSMVDLFAGPGGLDVAAVWVGLAAHGIEWDAEANATRRNAQLETTEGDVRAYGPALHDAATILSGGPPCQTFTVAGTGSGRKALGHIGHLVGQMANDKDITASLKVLEDERSGLILQPLKWILGAMDAGHPYEAVVLEQVQAALPIWTAMKPVLEALGYHVICTVLRTEMFGVPQTRRRAVLLANLRTQPITPEPTHQAYRIGTARLPQGNTEPRPWVSMNDALARPEWFEVISNYGSGGNPAARGRRTCEQPSATVTGKVSRNRLVDRNGRPLPRLTAGEAGALQTFPDDYPWDLSGWAQQVGNAIPPRLGVHLLAAVFGCVPDQATLDARVAAPWTPESQPAVVLVHPQRRLADANLFDAQPV